MTPQLKANMNFGEGTVVFPKKFVDLDPILRQDLLNDWIYELEKMREQSWAECIAHKMTFGDHI
jgi:hypothetical protein